MEIESRELTTCDVALDGEVVRLRFIDTAGSTVVLSLPFAQAGALTMTLPHLLTKALKARYGVEGSRFVFPLGEWVLEGVADGRTVIVTLRTTDGFEVSFAAPLERCRSLAADLCREAAEVAAAALAKSIYPGIYSVDRRAAGLRRCAFHSDAARPVET
jgi:hypothetical protein